MMSSSVLMASDHTTSLNLGEDLQTTRNDPHHQTAARKSSSTRRKTSRANEGCKKKQPQRGMGVAQLERLRLQERWKKITQINSASTLPLLSTTLDTSLFAEPKATNTGPVQFSKLCGFGTGVNGVGLNLMQQGFTVHKEGNVGSFLFHGQGMVSDDAFQGYLYGIGNMNGNSKELSSTPKVVRCYTDHCADCHKKKRTLTGENSMFNEANMYPNLPSVAGCDFTGLSVGSNGQNAKGGNGDLEKKATFLHSGTSALAFCNTDEAVALEKKGSSGSSGVPNALMEYEFFPGNGGCRSDGSSHNELLMMKKLMGNSETSAVKGGEASCFATTTSTTPTGGASVDASTSIDLSLRLSY